ncbi:hypothetical protein U9M48_008664 [Paspalum notatum var. saurae]|uniref:Uncharacterized protein n=1 Tax=Paspalum notatum var. saurae TaxID=547442 RepID=A0AAQ3SQ46_PASNO
MWRWGRQAGGRGASSLRFGREAGVWRAAVRQKVGFGLWGQGVRRQREQGACGRSRVARRPGWPEPEVGPSRSRVSTSKTRWPERKKSSPEIWYFAGVEEES